MDSPPRGEQVSNIGGGSGMLLRVFAEHRVRDGCILPVSSKMAVTAWAGHCEASWPCWTTRKCIV